MPKKEKKLDLSQYLMPRLSLTEVMAHCKSAANDTEDVVSYLADRLGEKLGENTLPVLVDDDQNMAFVNLDTLKEQRLVPVLDALLSMRVKAQDVVLVQNDAGGRYVLELVSEILDSATVLCEPFKALVFNTGTSSDTVSWSGWTFVPKFTAKELTPLLAVKE
jgi:hypothetical protein